jgi:type IV secretory pathway TraG/TraD family ATPase VirD4
MNRNEREQRVSGLLSQLAPFAVGEVAELVNGKEGAVTISDLLVATGKPQVFIVLIPTLKYQELGHQLGKLLCQELAWAIGERASREGNRATFTPVYLDEFSALVYPGFAQILNKARSSQVAIHLSHQSLGDLNIVSPDFAKIITTNTNVKCILGLNDPETADWFARHLGTETLEKKTERAQDPGFFSSIQKTGDLSLREVEAYKIHPNRLKNYTRGWGVLHLPSPLGNITEEVHFSPFSSEELPDNH